MLRLADVSIEGQIASEQLRSIGLSDHERAKYALRAGDLLAFRVNGSPSIVGRVISYTGPEDYAYCDHFIRFRLDQGAIDSRFAALAFQEPRVRAEVEARMVSSAGQNTVSQASFREIPLPLPPLAQQKRIVAAVDALRAEVTAAQERLTRVREILKRFRQAVLVAACSGRLTEGWRERFSVPAEWPTVEFGELIRLGPQNGIYKPQSAYGVGTPIVRIDDFRQGLLRPWLELNRVALAREEVAAFGLRHGDLLINRVNSMPHLGKSVVIPAMKEHAVFESNMMRCRLDTSRVRPEYAGLFLSSPNGKQELKRNAKHAVNQSSINQGDVRAVRVPLPSTAEQREITRRVEELMRLVVRIGADWSEATARTQSLWQAILGAALSGGLSSAPVTAPSDESACRA